MNTIEEFVGTYLEGAKESGGDNVLACCPLHVNAEGHRERHPSFWFSLTKGVWKCFSCSEKGNLPQLLRALGLNPERFKNLVDITRDELLKKATFNPLKPKAIVRKDVAIPERVLGEFDMCPVPLVEEDGFTERTLQYFGVGYDEKHARITFPLRDLTGTLIAISGRTVVEHASRYKVYDWEYKDFGLPEAVAPPKSALLWHAHEIYPHACFGPLQHPLVIVEGFKACMRVWDSGWTNVVALLGCTMSEDQRWIIERIGAPVILMLDQNKAGKKGTMEVGKVLSQSLRVQVASQYDGDQPSDLDENQVLTSLYTPQGFISWARNNPQPKKK